MSLNRIRVIPRWDRPNIIYVICVVEPTGAVIELEKTVAAGLQKRVDEISDALEITTIEPTEALA